MISKITMSVWMNFFPRLGVKSSENCLKFNNRKTTNSFCLKYLGSVFNFSKMKSKYES